MIPQLSNPELLKGEVKFDILEQAILKLEEEEKPPPPPPPERSPIPETYEPGKSIPDPISIPPPPPPERRD